MQKPYALLVLISCVMMGLVAVPTAHAANFTATQSGNWNDTATWGGGGTPGSSDNVSIPAAIVVTIPLGLTVTRDAVSTFTNDGTLDNNGTLTTNGGLTNTGFFTNNAGSTLTNNALFNNTGTITNNGTLTNNGFLNTNAGGTLNNNATLSNNGTINMNSGGILNNYATLTNNSTINNNGTIHNYCPGTITGNPVTGSAPINHECPTATPTSTLCVIVATSPTLISPIHRAHTTDHTPTFSWSTVAGSQSYRLMVYLEDRSFEYKKRVFVANYTLGAAEALTVAKYLWRVRTQDSVCSTWTAWSSRNTLFVD